MRSKLLVCALISMIAFGCSKSEQLDSDEQQYVKLSLALLKARAKASDSASVRRVLDSVYTALKSDSASYRRRTEAFAGSPDRAQLVFRAINDSLHGK